MGVSLPLILFGAHTMSANTVNHEKHAEHISVKTYVTIFVALMFLLFVTVEANRHDVGEWNIVIAMLIASVKAFLILMYFMHVKISSRLIAVFFIGSLYALGIGALLIFADYMMRS